MGAGLFLFRWRVLHASKGACAGTLFQRRPAVAPAGNLAYKCPTVLKASTPLEKARTLQEAMRLVTEACPELFSSIDKEAVEDATVVRYVLEYACSLSKGRFDSEAPCITFIVAKTAGAQPQLAESIVSAVEEHAATDTRLAANLRDLFDPVVVSSPKRIPNWQTGLREVLAAGSFYIFDIAAFEDKVRGTSGRRNLIRFRTGFNQFLLMKQVPDRKKRIILKRIGLILAPFGIGLLPYSASAQAIEGTVVHANAFASASAIKIAIGSLLLPIAVITGLHFRSGGACSKSSGLNPPASDSRSNSTGDTTYVLQNTPTAAPQDCAQLPPGPDRKSCLIHAADTRRDDLLEAQRLYRIAMDDTYDAASVHERRIDSGYWNPGWKNRASGPSLLLAQDFAARAGLASVLALHGEYAKAAFVWRQATDPMNAPSTATAWSYFDNGPYTDSESYIQNFLDTKAGAQTIQVHYGYPQLGYAYDEALGAELALAREDWVHALESAISATYFERLHPAIKLTLPNNSRYWRGILPSQQTLETKMRAVAAEALEKLERNGLAIEKEGVSFLIDSGKREVSALLARSLPDDPCLPEGERGWSNTNLPFWRVVSIRASRRTLQDHHGNGTDIFFNTIEQPGIPDNITATVAMTVVDHRGYHLVRCGAHEVTVLYCAKGEKAWFQDNEQPCRLH